MDDSGAVVFTLFLPFLPRPPVRPTGSFNGLHVKSKFKSKFLAVKE